MKRLIGKRIIPAVAAALLVAGGQAWAQHGSGEFIVNSQVISDTAAMPSSYVGDISSGQVIEGEIAGGEMIEGEIVGGEMAGSCAGGDCGDSTGSCIGAGCVGRGYDRSDLFYNYYSQGYNNSANAQMYISPLPVPPVVGHTFNTYQPLYPHHYLYWHMDRYHNNYDNGRGMNRTSAIYWAPPIRTALSNIYWNKLRLPR